MSKKVKSNTVRKWVPHLRTKCGLIYFPFIYSLTYYPWTQDVNWTFIKRSEGFQYVFWTSCATYVRHSEGFQYVFWTSRARSGYFLCPGDKYFPFISMIMLFCSTSSRIVRRTKMKGNYEINWIMWLQWNSFSKAKTCLK